MKIYVMSLLVTMLATGCANTVWVREKVTDKSGTTYNEIGGIPFFVKKEVYSQTTSYATTWFVTTLTVEKFLLTKKNDTYETVVLDKQSFEKAIDKSNYSKLENIKKEIVKSGRKNGRDVDNLTDLFSNIPSLTDFSSIKPERTGNSILSKWVVNKDEKYYLNAPLPWFGSSNLSHEQNQDGTLSKVSSNPDTKLAEGISSLIPLKEYLSGKYVDPLKDADSQKKAALEASTSDKNFSAHVDIKKLKPDSDLVYKVSLSINESGYVYRFDRQYDLLPTDNSPLPFDLDKGTYTRESLDSKPNQAAEEKKGKAIGLSGTIQFPEDWGK